nr:cobalamin biosynthesis protein [Bacteroidaceae bacterium]
RTERYRRFGCWAARIDDAANYLPARLTALLMILLGSLFPVANHASRRPCGSRQQAELEQQEAPPQRRRGYFRFLIRYGPRHASPNSGWPEAALAAILDCRFGGTHDYFGQSVPKPYIGDNPRPLGRNDLTVSLRLSLLVEVASVLLVALRWMWG